jgi:hypothetical protein
MAILNRNKEIMMFYAFPRQMNKNWDPFLIISQLFFASHSALKQYEKIKKSIKMILLEHLCTLSEKAAS